MNHTTSIGALKRTSMVAGLLRARYNSPRFLLNMHRLRALAILCIVTIHCTYSFNWTRHLALESFFNDLLDNSTILFVFISGFLFQHVNRSFDFGKYLGVKIRNVVMPYLIAAMPAIIYALVAGDLAKKYPELGGHTAFYESGWLLINGGAHLNYALWFMPVIFLYYLLAPMFRLFVAQPRLYGLLLVLIPLSIIEHRPTYEHGHNLALALYFLPVYLLGMCVGQYRQRCDAFIEKYLNAIAVVYLAFLFGHFLLSSHHGKYTVDQLMASRENLIDWLFIQQILMSFTLYGLVKKLDRFELPWLDFLAETSFTVYFVHLYILAGLRHLTHYRVITGNVSSVLGLLLVTVVLSCVVAAAVRTTFGRYSRSILGS